MARYAPDPEHSDPGLATLTIDLFQGKQAKLIAVLSSVTRTEDQSSLHDSSLHASVFLDMLQVIADRPCLAFVMWARPATVDARCLSTADTSAARFVIFMTMALILHAAEDARSSSADATGHAESPVMETTSARLVRGMQGPPEVHQALPRTVHALLLPV